MKFSLNELGKTVTTNIKLKSWFPYKTGNLKFNATQGQMITDRVFRISFDSKVAPYVVYLEEGTLPHDIPHAFGRPLPFGVGGRFDGKFHPGSKKHQNFIKNKCVNEVVSYIARKLNGKVEQI